MTNPEKQKINRNFATIYALSAAVITFLFWLIYYRDPQGNVVGWVRYLPSVNASLNSATAILLILGFIAIKRKKHALHIKLMITAVSLSVCFLISYIIYHYFQGDTKFLGQGMIRYFYFFLLISHIILSGVLVPLLMITLYFAATKNFVDHVKIVRFTFPIWLYVAISGVMVYVMLQFFNTLEN